MVVTGRIGAAEVGRHGQLWCTDLARDAGADGVEVRQRRSLAQGGAAASILSSKQRRIIFAARHFLARLASLPPCRFDAVLLQGRLDGPEPPALEWLRAAFDAS